MTFTPILTSIVRFRLLILLLAAISFTIAPNGVRADDYAYAIHQCINTWECDSSPKTRCCARYCDLTACNQTTQMDIVGTACSPQLNAYLVCMDNTNQQQSGGGNQKSFCGSFDLREGSSVGKCVHTGGYQWECSYTSGTVARLVITSASGSSIAMKRTDIKGYYNATAEYLGNVRGNTASGTRDWTPGKGKGKGNTTNWSAELLCQ
jgi:hypothetical protein